MLDLSTMTRRTYRQNCALAQAVDVVGERWTMLLIRDLLVAPRRFKDLAESLKGIGTNLLAARLKGLEAAGIIERRRAGDGKPTYALTPAGTALEPAILALVRWGLTHGPQNQPDYHHHDDWDLLALKALFQPHRAGDLRLTVQFESENLTGWMKIEPGGVTVGLGRRDHSDLIIAGTIAGLFLEADEPESLLVKGSEDDLERYMAAFALRA